MNTYPINLLLKNKACLIVGGGKVAVRKLTALLNSGALIEVVDPKPSDKMKILAKNDNIILTEREFVESDLDDVFLVYIASNDRIFNRELIKLTEARGILTCCVDANWNKGSFITPASINQNDITIAVSSQGVACRKTKLIKDNIARHIDSIENTGLMLIGTDHNSTGLDCREHIHLSGNRMDNAGKLIMTLWGIQEFMLLNTCNRIELIAAGHNDESIVDMIKMILKLESLKEEQYYIKSGFEAFRHICLVSSGLLSQTPGENHITSQIKQSFDYAQDKSWSGSLMKNLKDHILHVSKHIRTDIIPMLKVFEIEELAMTFLKSRILNLKAKHVLLVGTGLIGQAMKNLLIKEGCTIDWIYNTNKPVCRDKGVRIAKLNMLATKITKADIVISALSSEHPVISKETTQHLKDNVELIDLGSPRNIASELTTFKNVKLSNMEDLKHWHRKNNCDMDIVLEKANNIIDAHKDIYEKFKNSFIDGRQRQ